VAQELRGQGYRAYALRGGLDAWIEAGYPTEPKAVEQIRSVADACPDCNTALDLHGGHPRT
jgi:3-mercaptopyruvate sulfurtransferase SseA